MTVTVTVTDSKSAITKMFKKGSYSPTKVVKKYNCEEGNKTEQEKQKKEQEKKKKMELKKKKEIKNFNEKESPEYHEKSHPKTVTTKKWVENKTFNKK